MFRSTPETFICLSVARLSLPACARALVARPQAIKASNSFVLFICLLCGFWIPENGLSGKTFWGEIRTAGKPPTVVGDCGVAPLGLPSQRARRMACPRAKRGWNWGLKTVEKIDSFLGLIGDSTDKPLQIMGKPGVARVLQGSDYPALTVH